MILKEQCDYYLKMFEIKKEDFICLSYSDLILEKIFRDEAVLFLKKIEKLSEKANIALFEYEIDHLCYRVETPFEYYYQKEIFQKFSELLVESMVGGRLIASYKLFKPIQYKNQNIFVVELPFPKMGRAYKTGFEHAEAVIKTSFEDFEADHPKLVFDKSGAAKKHNPELRLKLEEGISLKFHHTSLETVIFQELSSNLTHSDT